MWQWATAAWYNTPDTDDDRIYRSTSALNWTTPTGTKPPPAST